MMPNRRHLLSGLTAAALLPFRALAQARPRKEVLVFYYGWYGTKARSGQDLHWLNPDTAHERIADAPNYPVGGPYDSLDPDVIAHQMAQIKAAGITGLIVSWWGQTDRTNDQLRRVLDAAGAQGLKVTAYVEQVASAEGVAEDTLYLYRTYARHPAWLRLDNKPVIMYFDRLMQDIGLDGWQKARALIEKQVPNAISYIATANTLKEIKARKGAFDGLHIYSQQFEGAESRLIPALWRAKYYSDWVRAQKGAKVTTATILPGFDDRLQLDRKGKRPVIKREDGKPFRDLWNAAIAAKPDWILIVSFNEWHEASQIEPSTAFGTRELETCRQMSAKFLR
ncbi:hypothetical protein [Asticcacaulis taihuensis]|uniref:hypothetical protein n=1 Tax=Asticcacaulis taihuensis TaxID=260084 RepID=UPI0026EFC526|nr:hypothetical protein [Asticcacaulis taihuensis]